MLLWLWLILTVASILIELFLVLRFTWIRLLVMRSALFSFIFSFTLSYFLGWAFGAGGIVVLMAATVSTLSTSGIYACWRGLGSAIHKLRHPYDNPPPTRRNLVFTPA